MLKRQRNATVAWLEIVGFKGESLWYRYCSDVPSRVDYFHVKVFVSIGPICSVKKNGI